MNKLLFKNVFLLLVLNFSGIVVAKEISPSCAEMDDAAIQSRWIELLTDITKNGFEIKQIKQALAALSRQIDSSETQKKLKDYFISKVQKPSMLLSDGNDASKMRHSFKKSLVEIDSGLEENLSPGDTPFTIHELEEAWNAVSLRKQELKAMENTDLSYVIEQRNKLNIDEIDSVLQMTIFLVKNTGENSQYIRRNRFFELQGALSSGDNLIKDKCRILEILN